MTLYIQKSSHSAFFLQVEQQQCYGKGMSLSETFTNQQPVVGFGKRRYDQKFKPTGPRQKMRVRSRSRRRFPKPKR